LTIRVNGEARDLADPVSISALLAALDIDPRRVAVEHNLVVVRREAYDSTLIADGDEVEIVNFVGGGSSPGPEDPGTGPRSVMWSPNEL